jgi:DNA-binding transcriptional regulator YiaG
MVAQPAAAILTLPSRHHFREHGDMNATSPLREQLRARSELPPPEVRRELREAAGISLETIGREIGVTRQAVGHWEAGTRYPRGTYLEAYVEVLRLLREAAA